MGRGSRLFQRLLRLGPPLTRDVVVHPHLPVPMPDGTVLYAERWAPRHGGDGLPTALIRTPYGRGRRSTLAALPLAERGFQVVVQSVRGTFGSGGAFKPMRNEREDGLATLDWLVKQPWCGDSVVLTGSSYLGYVQWAVADQLPPQVRAMVPVVTEAALTLAFLREDAFELETPFAWGVMVSGQERKGALLRQLLGARRAHRAQFTTPLEEADRAAIGSPSPYIQNILSHGAEDPHWDGVDQQARVAAASVPVSSVAGWFDIFLPGQLRDYRALRAAGREAWLTVGPWAHTAVGVQAEGARQTLEFGLPHARGERPQEREPVRLYVMGAEAWRGFESWPPAGYAPRRFHLQEGGGLATAEPGPSGPDRYRYDPADPTPAVGGVRFAPGRGGRKVNTRLEARADVLTYTTAVLDADTEVIGEVEAEVWFRSSLPYADVFVRLCDVDAKGRSRNVCDGLVGLSGADEITRASLRLWPTAHVFKRGHRIRVQVSSGAFPRYNRNPGTGEPRATAVTLRAADQRVFHDPEHPSAVVLPVRATSAAG
ncbi:CocE/NonD family hydrolase [Streptomyces sp. A7024]|uniref:CocE/NonD family hydrolase n=1 Tax=Streptomyces coryli TaxID=1128680 RepID=A0A6G4TXA9_9ACTN|nr:CocE/NonD family hydrolase [Streptomyces coryli]